MMLIIVIIAIVTITTFMIVILSVASTVSFMVFLENSTSRLNRFNGQTALPDVNQRKTKKENTSEKLKSDLGLELQHTP